MWLPGSKLFLFAYSDTFLIFFSTKIAIIHLRLIAFLMCPITVLAFVSLGPASAPVNLTVAYTDKSSVKVIWSRPLDLGGRTDLTYSVDCVGCDQKVAFLPRQTGLRSTR